MAHQSLYRRYRPRRFGELVGQQHVVSGLRNAVRDGRTGHAYLFSGPRGTGKTSTARILAKALNCTDLREGDPCGVCDSCLAIEGGSSYDLFELDAASNNKVEDIRDLVSRVAIGSPGRTKVYILDEVHMLSVAAANALLKTLEEPPDHVTFVLATTDPQKVLPTIRSRAQHFEFGLVPAAELERHVRWVIEDAALVVDDEGVDWVVRRGAGSVRDALSALDQVAAVGGVGAGPSATDELLEALCERDSQRAVVGLAAALSAGREPRLVAEDLLGRLRDAFLAAVAPELSNLPDREREAMAALVHRWSAAGVTRSLEAIGAAVLEMRQAPDARIPLEVALIRLTHPELDVSGAALAERLDRLERAATGAAPADAPRREAPTAPAPRPAETPTLEPAPPRAEAPGPAPRREPAPDVAAPATSREGAAAAARRQLAARQGGSGPAGAPPRPRGPAARTPSPPSPPPSPPPAEASPEPAASPGPSPTAPPGHAAGPLGIDELAAAWAGTVLDHLPVGARALYRAGQFVGVDGDVAQFALPSKVHRDRCEAKRADVEASLAQHFGRPVTLRLVVDERPTDRAPGGRHEPPHPDPEPDLDEDVGDIADLEDAPAASTTGIDLLVETFPGAEVVE